MTIENGFLLLNNKDMDDAYIIHNFSQKGSQYHQIHSVDLSNSSITNLGLKHLNTLLKFNKIKYLNIDDTDICLHKKKDFNILDNFQSLVYFSFSRCPRNTNKNLFLDWLKSHPTLQHIVLRGELLGEGINDLILQGRIRDRKDIHQAHSSFTSQSLIKINGEEFINTVITLEQLQSNYSRLPLELIKHILFFAFGMNQLNRSLPFIEATISLISKNIADRNEGVLNWKQNIELANLEKFSIFKTRVVASKTGDHVASTKQILI